MAGIKYSIESNSITSEWVVRLERFDVFRIIELGSLICNAFERHETWLCQCLDLILESRDLLLFFNGENFKYQLKYESKNEKKKQLQKRNKYNFAMDPRG